MNPAPGLGRGLTGRWLLRLAWVTLLVGVGAGVGGGALSIILHVVEHLAYGYQSGTLLEAATHTPPLRRFIALVVAGIVGALGWYAIRRWLPPIRSVTDAVAGKRMPALATVLNTVLQMVVVGLGGSVGREGAPRELAALFSGWLSDVVGLTARERRVMVACGAGAGLAAVYSVPLGGALFTIEVLLAEVSLATVIPAFVASGVATLVASPVVPSTPWYVVPNFAGSWNVVVWSVVAGPVIGFAASGFTWMIKAGRRHRPRGWRILIAMPLVFASVGVIALFTPTVVGNGRALGQTAFDGTLGIGVIAVLTIAKTYATTASLAVGTAGGTLTPSIAIGAGFGATLGGLWIVLWPGAQLGAFALIGAAAFLASTMRAPLTGLVLVIEFSHSGTGLLVPLVLAVAGAVSVGYLMGRRRVTGVP